MKKGGFSLLVAGILVLLGCFLRFALAGYGFGALCLWGAAAVLVAFWLLGLWAKKSPRLAGVLRKLLTYGVIVGLLLLGFTLAVVIKTGPDEHPDGAAYAVVLGAGVNGTQPSLSLRTRLEAALAYAEANPETVFILSGGQGSGEAITEAQCMADWLTGHGLAASRLLLEEAASSTEENLAFSWAILQAREPGFGGKVCLISETYHLCRAKLWAGKAGYPWVVAYGGYNGLPLLTATYYLRECAGVWAFWLLG